MKALDLTGTRYGFLTVVSRAPLAATAALATRKAYWSCLCDCGAMVTVRGDNLTLGRSTSCGDHHTATTGRAPDPTLHHQHPAPPAPIQPTPPAITVQVFDGRFSRFTFGFAVATFPRPEGDAPAPTVVIPPMPRPPARGSLSITVERLMHELHTRGHIPERGGRSVAQWMRACGVTHTVAMRSQGDEEIRAAYARVVACGGHWLGW